MSKACCNINDAMWTSSSSLYSCAENDQEPIELAKSDSLLDSRVDSDLTESDDWELSNARPCNLPNVERIRDFVRITNTRHEPRYPVSSVSLHMCA